MDITYKDVKNPRYSNAAGTRINVDVNFDHLTEEFVPFTADECDCEPHGQEIFKRAKSGEFGKIAEYVEPKAIKRPTNLLERIAKLEELLKVTP